MTSSIAIHVVRMGWPHLAAGEVCATPIAQGRFSSDPLWKLTTDSGVFALRGWSADRIKQAQKAHDFVRQVSSRFGLPLPLPESSSSSKSFYELNELAWELAPWLTGEPLHSEPNLEQLKAAAATLAELHLAGCEVASETVLDPISQYTARVKRLQDELHAGQFSSFRLDELISNWSVDWPKVSQALCKACDQLLEELGSVSHRELPTQWIWGDAWHGNFLFAGDRVSALVDFAAVRVDTPLADVARLLGATTDYHSSAWSSGLEAYSRISGLSPHDLQVISVLHTCGTVLSLANWLSWSSSIAQMPDPAAGLTRLGHFAGRLAGYLGFSKRSV